VTALDGLRGVTTAAMQPRAHVAGERDNRGHRFHLRLVMVSHDRCGRRLCARQGLTKKYLRTGPISPVTQEYINDLSVLSALPRRRRLIAWLQGEFGLLAYRPARLQPEHEPPQRERAHREERVPNDAQPAVVLSK
jgi:hypothetical protein